MRSMLLARRRRRGIDPYEAEPLTPTVPTPVSEWLNSLPTEHIAGVCGAATQLMAIRLGVTEAQLYEHYLQRTVADESFHVVR
jgi:hypothetical protein